MFKLFQINVTANWGSTGKIAEAIGIAAMKAGWESYIAYGRWSNPSQSHLIKIGSDFDVYEHFAETRLLDNHGLASRIATHTFIHQIQEIKPDIVHLHNIHGYYLNYKLLFEFLSQKDVPIVWTLHDCWSFTGHCSYFDIADCERWKQGCYAPCPCKREYPASYLMDSCEKNWFQKEASFTSVKNMTLVPVSKWLSKLIKESFMVNYPVQMIHNGIDLDVFCPQTGNFSIQGMDLIKGKRIVLGVASVWDSRKGLSDFVWLRERLTDDWVLVLVGLNEEQLKTLPKGIVGIKRTQNQHELAQLYSFADVFVNPTYEDNFPTTNLEALACGTPVITYRTGGSPEAIDEKTGLVVEQGNVSALADAIKELCLRDREQLSKDCRARAEEHFDKNKCFEKYVRLYDELIIKY